MLAIFILAIVLDPNVLFVIFLSKFLILNKFYPAFISSNYLSRKGGRSKKGLFNKVLFLILCKTILLILLLFF